MTQVAELSHTIPEKTRNAIENFRKSVVDALGDQVGSVIVYGGVTRDEYYPSESDVNVLLVLTDVSVAVLDKIVRPYQKGFRDINLDAIILTEDQLRGSMDVFPVRFKEMKQSHQLIWGRDVLADLDISDDYLKLLAVQEIKNLQLRLHRIYLLNSRKSKTLQRALTSALAPYLSALGAALVVKTGQSPIKKRDIAETASAEFDLDFSLLQSPMELKSHDRKADVAELRTLYDSFMTTVDRTADIVDNP